LTHVSAFFDDPNFFFMAGTLMAREAVLGDPSFRRNAERLRDEMVALPGPEYAVALLERLAVEKQPLLTS
jgi:hypothetical protein